MRNSLVLTTLTAVGLVMSMAAHAQDARSTLDAQSTSSAQVQTESKGFFSGLGDRMHTMFRKHDSASIDTQTMADTDMNTTTTTDTTTTTTDDTIDNNEEVNDDSAAMGSADVDTSADVNVGGVDASVSADVGSTVDEVGGTVDGMTGGGVGVQTNTNAGVHSSH